MTQPYEVAVAPPRPRERLETELEAERSVGWMVFAAVMLAVGGSLNGVLIMPGAPFLALALFATNVLVMYALIAHGRQWRDG
jgi:hypothetical protein